VAPIWTEFLSISLDPSLCLFFSNEMPPDDLSRHRPSGWDFNKEIVIGECGSLSMAYGAAFSAAHFTQRAAVISGSIVAGTLVGGTLFWLAARILHQRAGNRWSARVLANDIGYFTPAAIVLGFAIYDPAIFLVSRSLLNAAWPVAWAVMVSQFVAFTLFLTSMNAYRIILRKVRGKRL
jgi:hypothetical protein